MSIWQASEGEALSAIYVAWAASGVDTADDTDADTDTDKDTGTGTDTDTDMVTDTTQTQTQAQALSATIIFRSCFG